MLIGYPSSYHLCTLKPLILKKTGLTYVAIQCTLKFSKMMNIFDRDVLSGKCIQAKGLVDTECLPEQACRYEVNRYIWDLILTSLNSCCFK